MLFISLYSSRDPLLLKHTALTFNFKLYRVDGLNALGAAVHGPRFLREEEILRAFGDAAAPLGAQLRGLVVFITKSERERKRE